jgi:hypothetical protein
MAMNMLLNSNKPQQQQHSSGLGGLAAQFLGGNSHSNSGQAQNQSHNSGGAAGLVGKLAGNFLGGGNKPHGQQQNSASGHNSAMGGLGGLLGGGQQSSGSHSNAGANHQGGAMGALGGLLGGHSSSVCTHYDRRFTVSLTIHSKTISKATVIRLEDLRKQAHIPDRLPHHRTTLRLLTTPLQLHMASLRALTVAQVDRPLALTAPPLTAPQDSNMDSTSRHTAAGHHQANTAASPRMLLRVTNMTSTANISITSMVAHQTTARLNKTRNTMLTSLAREAVMDSSLVVNRHMAGYHREEHLTVDHNTGNRLMAGQVRNSSLTTSTISTAEHKSSWASIRHRMEAMEDKVATMVDRPLQHGDRLQQRNRDGHACSLDESWVRMHSVRSEDQ